MVNADVSGEIGLGHIHIHILRMIVSQRVGCSLSKVIREPPMQFTIYRVLEKFQSVFSSSTLIPTVQFPAGLTGL